MATLVISYSRVDRPQVRSIVSLLRTAFAGIERAVFWDEDFEPGDPWFEQIKLQIDAAPQLFVFWCSHSASSAQVRREFAYAFAQQKRVVPVLLDDTVLASDLASIHGVDLRGAILHPLDEIEDSTARPPALPMKTRSRQRRIWERFWLMMLFIFGLAGIGLYFPRSEGSFQPTVLVFILLGPCVL